MEIVQSSEDNECTELLGHGLKYNTAMDCSWSSINGNLPKLKNNKFTARD